jgi:ankyrin repeat/BTB/POZ domain-containing protein 1
VTRCKPYPGSEAERCKASLCGHYEVVQLLLESGALCERDTFQGERCLYNALNDRIRNLLLSYDYSKSTDPLQPFASHITSLLTKDHPKTSDINVASPDRSFNLHKFILSARSPYFRKKLANAPDTTSWKLPPTIPPQAFDIAIKYVYLGEIPNDVGGGPGTGYTEEEVLEGIEKISKHLEISSLWQGILESSDRRLARQNRTEEVERGRNQLEGWFRDNVLRHKIILDSSQADEVKWDRDNGIFADVLLRADDISDDETSFASGTHTPATTTLPIGIPVGPLPTLSTLPVPSSTPKKSTLYPTHRAMLLRSEYFHTMFSSSFLEAQDSPHLRIISVDCSPEVLEIVLTFLYTEKADIPLHLAIDVLFAADLLFIEKLKTKTAVVISTLGNGAMPQLPSKAAESKDINGTADNSVSYADHLAVTTDINPSPSPPPAPETSDLDIYTTLRAAWTLRIPRLEEFSARFIAYRLEAFIDDPEFVSLVEESAARIRKRQETDSIELVDDIRYYLSERFRLRMEDLGWDELEEEGEGNGGEGVDGVGEEKGLLVSSVDGKGEVVVSDGGARDGEARLSEVEMPSGAVRTLDGEMAGDEFAADALNYQILLGKIDALLERLKLDA